MVGERAGSRFARVAEPEFRLAVPARPEHLALVRRLVDGVCESLGAPDDVADDIRLAVTEACTNVVRHAYTEGDGTIDVSVHPAPRALEIVVADAGCGVGPSHDTAGPGLGLPLIEALADRVEIGPAEGGGSRLTMCFDRERLALGHA